MFTTPQQAVELRTEALAAERALAEALGTWAPETGSTGMSVHRDLGIVIVYASTSTHTLVSRTNGRGTYLHRINFDRYEHASDIPPSFRKLGAIARAVETSDTLVREALRTRYRADLALKASDKHRDNETRQEATDLLAQPTPWDN